MKVDLKCNSAECRVKGSVVQTPSVNDDTVYIVSFCPTCGNSIHKFLGGKNDSKSNKTGRTKRRKS